MKVRFRRKAALFTLHVILPLLEEGSVVGWLIYFVVAWAAPADAFRISSR